MQIRVITFKSDSTLIVQMQSLFPTADVRIQRAIDVRSANTSTLLASDLITHASANALTHGRRWHHEVGTKGAIGLAQANRLAVEEDPTQPLLLLEEDCRIVNSTKFKREVAQLLSYPSKFDMAVFGALYKGNRSNLQADETLPRGFKIMKDTFWLMHCVLYTPSGREKARQILYQPLDMQIDSLYGSEARFGDLIVLGQVDYWSAVQAPHVSTVQTTQSMVHNCSIVVALVLCLVSCTYIAIRKWKSLR